jgi:hypothetical protein
MQQLQQQQQQAQQQAQQQQAAQGGGNRPQSSSASSKLRQALDMSHRLDNTPLQPAMAPVQVPGSSAGVRQGMSQQQQQPMGGGGGGGGGLHMGQMNIAELTGLDGDLVQKLADEAIATHNAKTKANTATIQVQMPVATVNHHHQQQQKQQQQRQANQHLDLDDDNGLDTGEGLNGGGGGGEGGGQVGVMDDDDDEGFDDMALGTEGVINPSTAGGNLSTAGMKRAPAAVLAAYSTGGMNNHLHNGGGAGGGGGGAEGDDMDGRPLHMMQQPSQQTATTAASTSEWTMTNTNNTMMMMSSAQALSSTSQVRNTSMDSFSNLSNGVIIDPEAMIHIGLTTVPNQFCTKQDALELKKLLLLSNGVRGGIVPSSSAVMDMYMVGKVVGVGSYGKVRCAWHRLTGSKIAIKTYDKARLKDPAHWKRVYSEIKIMESISHPRISRLYEAVETPKRMHLIMECLDGGNLCSYVKAKRRLSEEESRKIFVQILQAIDYLHNTLSVAHRDVKLENVLFVGQTSGSSSGGGGGSGSSTNGNEVTSGGFKGDVKLIDFGFSTVCPPGKKLKVFCGTPSCTFACVCC